MRGGLGLAVVAMVTWLLLVSGGTPTSRVDALFDTATGIVPGQVVKIAGARVGTVDGVHLVRVSGGGYEARMELSIESRFTPFRANATCKILPEGLISENYVECYPGSPTAPVLPAGATGYPEIPVAHTTAALTLQDVLDVFALPTDQRLGLFLDQIGVGTAGRGADINAIIGRAVPALGQARRLLTILDAQASRLQAAVGQSDLVLSALAARGEGVRRFVDDTAGFVRETAAHSRALQTGIGKLPGMLVALRSGLGYVDRVTSNGPPLLSELHAASVPLGEVSSTLPAFSTAAVPALRSLGTAAESGLRAIPPALPAVRELDRLATVTQPFAPELAQMLTSFRDRGGIEGMGHLLYQLSTLVAPYDSISHFGDFFLTMFPQCMFANATNQVAAGCQHKYTSASQGEAPINNPAASPGPNTADLLPVATSAATDPNRRPLTQAQLRSLVTYLLK